MRAVTYREEEHLSYRKHRRQVWTQILLPVIVAALVIVAGIVAASLVTFNGGGDSARWAAIAGIWLAIPVVLVCIIIVAILAALVFGLGKAAGFLPAYTFRAQMLTRRVESAVKQGGEMIRRPPLAIRSLANRLRSHAPRKIERMGKQ